MRLLIDTNVFLEVLLEQARAEEAQLLLAAIEGHEFFISDFSLHSIGLLLFRRNQFNAFQDFDKTKRGRKTPAEIIGASG